MTKRGKTIAVAWFLLSVFVSVIMLSGLHHHETVANAASCCVDCTHHVHHSGHFSKATNQLDDCVLCQFLCLVYTASTTTIITLAVSYILKRQYYICNIAIQEASYPLNPRAPPFIL